MKVELLTADYGHVASIAARMRQPDVDEAWAAARIEPYQALEFSMLASRDPITAAVDGRPVCMFGVSTSTPFSEVGHPWLLGTPELEEHAVRLLRASRRYVRMMREEYSTLENYVDARNAKALQWVQWLGFALDPAQPFGFEQRLFYRFHWSESQHVL